MVWFLVELIPDYYFATKHFFVCSQLNDRFSSSSSGFFLNKKKNKFDKQPANLTKQSINFVLFLMKNFLIFSYFSILLQYRIRVEFYENENTFKEKLHVFFIKNQRTSKSRIFFCFVFWLFILWNFVFWRIFFSSWNSKCFQISFQNNAIIYY